MAAALHRDLALELEDARPLPARRRVRRGGAPGALELVAEEARLHDPEVRPSRVLAPAQDLGRGEDRVARKEGCQVPPGAVGDVAERVVADVGRGEPEAEPEGDPPEDDEAPADVARRVEVDHELVAVHLARVVEDGRQVDVLVGDGAPAGVLDQRAGLEVLEVGVGAREVRERLVPARGFVGWEPELALDAVGGGLPGVERCGLVPLVDLDLALPGEHDRLFARADVLAGRRLHVDDPEVRLARGGADPEHLRLYLDRVADVERGAEAHVDVLEVGAGVLRDVLDRLAEGHEHHEPGRADEALEAVGAGVARVLGERVRGHRELGEGREEALGQRLPALVPEYLPRPEILEEVAGLLADAAGGVGHRGGSSWARESSSTDFARLRLAAPGMATLRGTPRRRYPRCVREPSPNALRVLEARYLLRDAAGRVIEDFEGLCHRVATAVAAAEPTFGGDAAALAERFFGFLARREFLPNSPTLMNAGTPLGQLSACFVLPIEDSLESIFEAAKRMAVIHQSGGGTGFSFSRLRPAGDLVQTSPGIASGPVSFIGVFDAATAVIRQGGRRRGANMGVLRVDHPDVLDFVSAKAEAGRIANFNPSVAATDAFFQAAASGKDFDLVNPRDGRVARSLPAREILAAIAEHAWASGDPGLLFLDAIERGNPTPSAGPIEATNPCGELPLLANESCNLGSLRLDAFVRGGPLGAQGEPWERALDWERLDAAVDLAVRFLDDVIEVSRFPFPEIARTTRRNRKIGLGVMGFADLLVDLGVPYDSPRACEVAGGLMERIASRAERASAALAAGRGVFPGHAGSRAAARGLRLRNATLLSIAPTGTLSILADCSGGIEPYFALAFVRHVLDGERLPETNPRFEAALRREGAWSDELAAELRERGSARGVPGVPERIQRLFPTAADVAPEAHLAVQQAFQRSVDNAVSKTINLPAAAGPELVREIYVSAWRRGLKGVTVFREGCKGRAVLVRGSAGLELAPDAPACTPQRCD